MDHIPLTTLEHWNAEAFEHLLHEQEIDSRPRREKGKWHPPEALPGNTPIVQATTSTHGPRLVVTTVHEALTSLGPEAFADDPWPGDTPLPEPPAAVVASLLEAARRAWIEPAREANLATAQVRFEGSGDSGQLEYVELLRSPYWGLEEGKGPTVPTLAERPWGWASGQKNRWRLALVPLKQALEEDATHIANWRDELPDWTNDAGGNLQLRYDLQTGARTIEVYQYPDPVLIYDVTEPPVAA